MAGHSGQFKAGNDPRRGKSGGRPKKPEWLKGKGEEALRYMYSVMVDRDAKTDLRIQCATKLAEYDLGKPVQAMDLQAELGPETTEVITMGLRERGEALRSLARTFGTPEGGAGDGHSGS